MLFFLFPQLFSTLPSLPTPGISSLACSLSNFPLSSGSPGQSSLCLQQLQNPAAAQPPLHSDHKPSFLSYSLLPVHSHTQRTEEQRPGKSPEVLLLQHKGGWWG